MRVTVLPSPLLPATAYTLLGEALRDAGVESWVADPSLSGDQTADDLIRRWSVDTAAADVLVAHSNAGYLAPLVRDRNRSCAGIVFMDAALLPESGRAPLAPEGFRSKLVQLTDERGVLPPWTQWWPRADLAAVVPEDLFDALDQGGPRLPLSYFDHRLEAPQAWAGQRNAYLAFGDTYEEELTFARERGWPTRRIGGGHLHFLHQPAAVADAVLTLARQLRDAGR